MALANKTKELRIGRGTVKGAGKTSTPTPEQLEKIHQFTKREFKAEEVYVRQMRLCNNCIDRDKEVFSQGTFDGFVKTIIGKAVLVGHAQRAPGVGRFFDVEVEKMSLEQAKAETGEDLVLPDGVSEVVFMSPWFYVPVKTENEGLLIDVDAGIYNFTSIGFGYENLVKVTNDDGETLYWEYRGNGEAREGSLVWLGAQRGTETKNVKVEETTEGVETMKDDEKKALEDKLKAAESAALTAGKALDDVLKAAGVKDIGSLKALLAEAKEVKDGVVDEQIKFEQLTKRCGTTPEEVEARKKEIEKQGVKEIKGNVAFLKTMAPPADEQMEGNFGENRDNSTVKGGESAGKKDLSDPENNELIT